MATETFGQRLRRIRTERNISQDQLAEALHTTRQTVSSWENDKSAIDYFALVDLQMFQRELQTHHQEFVPRSPYMGGQGVDVPQHLLGHPQGHHRGLARVASGFEDEFWFFHCGNSDLCALFCCGWFTMIVIRL